MKKGEIVTFARVRDFVTTQTCCCEVKKKSLRCTLTWGELHQPCNLLLTMSGKNFILTFSPDNDSVDADTLQQELVEFFDQFKLSPKNVQKKRGSVLVTVPAPTILTVLPTFKYFTPDNDEVDLLQTTAATTIDIEDDDDFFTSADQTEDLL